MELGLMTPEDNNSVVDDKTAQPSSMLMTANKTNISFNLAANGIASSPNVSQGEGI